MQREVAQQRVVLGYTAVIASAIQVIQRRVYGARQYGDR